MPDRSKPIVIGRAVPASRIAFAFRYVTARRRVLPDFLVIGGMKCGTSFLHNQLAQHPFVCRPWCKEVHYFDYPMNFRKGTQWYQAHFATRSQIAGTNQGRLVTGEASPYYMTHPLVPERIAAVLPQVKLIALLRNPVDRAYSHFHHERRVGAEDISSFEEAVKLESRRVEGAEERLANDPAYYGFHHQHSTYLNRGIYVDHLLRWCNYFPRNQLHIVKSEDLYSAPQATLTTIYQFLRIPQSATQIARNAAAARGRYDPIQPETYEQLAGYFEPHNRRLYEWLGKDLEWNQRSPIRGAA